MKQITDNIWFDTFELDSNYIILKEENLFNIVTKIVESSFWLLTKEEFENFKICELQYVNTITYSSYEDVLAMFKLFSKHKLENQSLNEFYNECLNGFPDRVKNDPWAMSIWKNTGNDSNNN